MKFQKTVDWSLVIVFNFMWATQVPVVKLIGERLSAITVAFIPIIVSTIIFLPVLWLENIKRKVPMRWRWKDIKYFMLPGLIGIFLMQYAYTLGSRMTLAANAGIITLTIPVLVAVLASFMLNERLNLIRVLSFILALFGVLMTSVSDIYGSDFIHSRYFMGNLIFLFACLCCVFYNTYCKMLIDKGYTELEILVYSSVIGSIASLPLLIWVEPFRLSEFMHSGSVAFFGILELSLIVYGISTLLFFYVLKRMDVTQAILGNYLLPFLIAFLGILLLKESINMLMVTGGVIILLSTLMVSVYEKELIAFTKSFKLNRGKKNI